MRQTAKQPASFVEQALIMLGEHCTTSTDLKASIRLS